MSGRLVSDTDLSDEPCDSDFSLADDDVPTRPIVKKAPVVKKPAKGTGASATSATAATALPVSAVAVPSTTSTASTTATLPAAAQDSRPVEEIYQKKTQLEHILLRPDTYIGSVERITQQMWVYDAERECMVNRPLSFVPGLFKIFDELLVNAADNKIRDPTMDTLRVDIDREHGRISIFNNGRGIPIEMHAKEGVWVPELIFGHLLTSSNYNDDQKKVTGGRNGYGAKLCNIFSREFIVETADAHSGKHFRQVFSANMSHRTAPVITKTAKSVKDDFTRITFTPDLAKFGMDALDDDLVALFTKRVYDLAGVVRDIKVFFNGERLRVRNFKQYVELYVNKNEALQQAAAAAGQSTPPLIHSVANDRWEVCFALSDGQFQQVSFVNAINTYKGGTHVTHVADQIVSALVDAVKRKNKAAPVKPFQVKNHLFVFVNCLVENPTFDSQTKENMTLRASAFGSKCELGEDFMRRVLKSGVLENILSWAKFKQEQLLRKTDGVKRSRLAGIAKLDDANNAGTRHAARCTLVLTEGDSAKALAVSGLSVVGRDNWGVFPLRGKLLNVREASHRQIMDNQEINHIKQIMGLQHGKVYDSADSLRYGRLMIMTDQDHDGSHIKGLLINLLDHFWPSLLRVPGFLVEFITPIVRCTRIRSGPPRPDDQVSFFTLPEYEQWRTANGGGRGWTIKYYKGLGTSTAADAKAYFSRLDTHVKQFEPATDEDRALVDMAFNKKKADDRKDWLKSVLAGTFIDHNRTHIPLRDFINHELVLFSQADNVRSIPSVVDGLKPGHRKIIFSCFKRRLRGEIKVAQLAGYVAEHSAYHHGEQSLCATIVGLAQSFVGSNNVNLLEPNGQFGTRLQGGKDAASPRYIFTSLSPLARLLFRTEDDALLRHLNEDGQDIEPEWYAPILPLVLMNGSEGIGTGWSTFIPNYNPADLVDCVQSLLDSSSADGEIVDAEAVTETLRARLKPWYRGFTGSIDLVAPDKYRVAGRWTRIDAETVEITELPIGTWTQSYKEMLEGMLTGTTAAPRETAAAATAEETEGAAPAPQPRSTPAFIRDYREHHTDTTVRFVVTMPAANLAAAEAEGFERRFKLATTLSTSNIVCFDALGRIRRYAHPVDILLDFFPLRLAFYQRRKAHLVEHLTREWTRFSNQVRFIDEIVAGTLVVQGQRRAILVAELLKRGFEPANEARPNSTSSTDSTDTAVETAAEEEPASLRAFDYLLDMSISSLTHERATQLRKERDLREANLQALLARTPKDLWRADLEEFRVAWMEAARAEEANATTSSGASSSAASKTKRPKTARPAAASSAVASSVTSSSVTSSSVASSLSNAASTSQGRLDSFLTRKPASEPVDDALSLPLAERIQRMLGTQPTVSTASTVAKPASRAAAAKRIVVESSSEDTDDEEDAYCVDDDDDDEEEEEEEDSDY